MVGIIRWKTEAEEQSGRPVRVQILQMQFLCVYISRGRRTPESLLRRRVAAAARRLRREGIIQVILPQDSGWEDLVAKCGLRPYSTMSLRRALAGEWLRCALRENHWEDAGCAVAVAADQLTGEVVRTVTELTMRYRYVCLDVPRGGEALCRQLRRDYGVALQLCPTAAQLQTVRGIILFAERAELDRADMAVAAVYDETIPMPEMKVSAAVAAELPEELDRTQLLTALWEGGALRDCRREIEFVPKREAAGAAT